MAGRIGVRSVLVGVASTFVLLALAGSVLATNFGSNTASYLTPAHPCDADDFSQCIANNGLHSWYPDGLEYNQLSATRYASNWVYDPVTDVDTTEVSSASGVDLIVRDWTYNNVDAWAWVQCDAVATYGGTDPHRWCRPQVLRYDLSDTTRYDEVFERRYMACHEMGHSLGLRHSSNSASCLFPNQATSDVLVANDEVIELNGHY